MPLQSRRPTADSSSPGLQSAPAVREADTGSLDAGRAQLAQRTSGAPGDAPIRSLSLWGSAAETQGDTTQGDPTGDGGQGAGALARISRLIGEDDATGAREEAARFAAARRAAVGGDDALVQAAGKLWTAADRIVRASEALAEQDATAAKTNAHQAAEMLRSLRSLEILPADGVEAAIARAGQIWSRSSSAEAESQGTNGQAHDGYAVWTTGQAGGGITSRPLNRDGNWSQDNWLDHHSDRSNSWAAGNIRNAKNQDLQAYDFTFERQNERGEAIAGSAQGLELISPWDAKVHDVCHDFASSGGYGKFIALEDLETGLRFEVHHLDTVADVRKGGTLNGGDIIGTQGASGRRRYDFATHVDIVGTPEAVEKFVRANQSGRFKSNKRRGGA